MDIKTFEQEVRKAMHATQYNQEQLVHPATERLKEYVSVIMRIKDSMELLAEGIDDTALKGICLMDGIYLLSDGVLWRYVKDGANVTINKEVSPEWIAKNYGVNKCIDSLCSAITRIRTERESIVTSNEEAIKRDRYY